MASTEDEITEEMLDVAEDFIKATLGGSRRRPIDATRLCSRSVPLHAFGAARDRRVDPDLGGEAGPLSNGYGLFAVTTSGAGRQLH